MIAKNANTPNPWVDPDDAPELTDEFFATATPMIGDKVVPKEEFDKAFKKALRGRPPLANPKKVVNIRLSPEVLTSFKATGRGWQTRIDNALRDWLKEHPPA